MNMMNNVEGLEWNAAHPPTEAALVLLQPLSKPRRREPFALSLSLFSTNIDRWMLILWASKREQWMWANLSQHISGPPGKNEAPGGQQMTGNVHSCFYLCTQISSHTDVHHYFSFLPRKQIGCVWGLIYFVLFRAHTYCLSFTNITW